ncbi:MAG: carboxymuconolactone decarboxylase family protein [Candidatus Tectomicrobia bacterium]|nr:carboxymuconolactone decarboxylase family protein [Candidatus Tectomicrobia bacterium]
MARIREVDPRTAPPEIQRTFEEQRELYGEVLNSSKISAHRPTVFHANMAFGRAIDESGLLPVGLRSLLCVRVAQINGCPF